MFLASYVKIDPELQNLLIQIFNNNMDYNKIEYINRLIIIQICMH